MIDDRVFVMIEQDASGYPPVDEEEIWADRVSDTSFRIAAPPMFARGLSCGDLVHVTAHMDRWYVDSVLTAGGHSTLRVVLFNDGADDRLLARVSDFGCDAQHTTIGGFFVIDVPAVVDYQALRSVLREGQQDQVWDVDEGNIALAHEEP